MVLTVSSGSVRGLRARVAWAGERGDSQLRRTYQTIVRRMGKGLTALCPRSGRGVRRMSAGETSTWMAVAQASDLPPESARIVRAAGLDLALIRTSEGFFALDNACPHTGGPLGEGLVQKH